MAKKELIVSIQFAGLEHCAHCKYLGPVGFEPGISPTHGRQATTGLLRRKFVIEMLSRSVMYISSEDLIGLCLRGAEVVGDQSRQRGNCNSAGS